jgi:hypothetical protein
MMSTMLDLLLSPLRVFRGIKRQKSWQLSLDYKGRAEYVLTGLNMIDWNARYSDGPT